MKIEEINIDGSPDNFPWHMIFLFLSIFGCGIITGALVMAYAIAEGWWIY